MEKKKETKTEKVQVRFTPTEHELLQRKAEEEGRKAANLIHTVTMSYLKNN